MKPLDHIAALLAPGEDQSSEIVEWQMNALLGWVKETYTEESDAPIADNMLRYSKGFWKGLFTCYDHYYIPRTNNDLEQFFRQAKASHRRITGLRNWNSYIMRNGEMIVLVQDALRQPHLIQRLRSVPFAAYKACKQRWDNRLSGTIQRRRFNRAPDAYLSALEQQWDQLNG